MVVGHLCVVDYPAVYVQPVRQKYIYCLFLKSTEHSHTFGENICHIVRQVVTVRSRIGEQLLFVKALHNGERSRR